MKVSDFIANYLTEKGIGHIFMVTGGGIMQLVDAVGRNEKLNYTCNHHEQACVVAAEGYARITQQPGVALVTIGPGAGNAVAGVFGAWYDSIPMIIISGQVRSDLIADYDTIRQKGVQEGNIIDTVKNITKYAVSVTKADDIVAELDKAYTLAVSGRPGPVWIELPTDIQAATISEAALKNRETTSNAAVEAAVDASIEQAVEMILASKRPLFIPGAGITISNAREKWFSLLEENTIPGVTAATSKDLLVESDERCMGVFGTNGQRRANFAVQNSDCLIILAAGLNINKVGFNFKQFGGKAKKIIVDIDHGQVYDLAITPDVGVVCDIHYFLEKLKAALAARKYSPDAKWLEGCKYWKEKYPIVQKEYFDDKEHVNMYVFTDKLSDILSSKHIVIGGNGFDCVSLYQGFKVKKDQRLIISCNWGSMGWDLPLSIGAQVAAKDKRVVCVTGDGSFQFNSQELLTISYYRLPIKIFVFNNKGYASIRSTQNSLMDGRLVGSDANTGVMNPNYAKLAEAYNLQYFKINNNDELASINDIIQSDSPALCEVNIDYNVIITPKASAFKREDGTLESRPLEDMFPFLPREEVQHNMSMFDE